MAGIADDDIYGMGACECGAIGSAVRQGVVVGEAVVDEHLSLKRLSRLAGGAPGREPLAAVALIVLLQRDDDETLPVLPIGRLIVLDAAIGRCRRGLSQACTHGSDRRRLNGSIRHGRHEQGDKHRAQ
jgi:hypothetical protein